MHFLSTVSYFHSKLQKIKEIKQDFSGYESGLPDFVTREIWSLCVLNNWFFTPSNSWEEVKEKISFIFLYLDLICVPKLVGDISRYPPYLKNQMFKYVLKAPFKSEVTSRQLLIHGSWSVGCGSSLQAYFRWAFCFSLSHSSGKPFAILYIMAWVLLNPNWAVWQTLYAGVNSAFPAEGEILGGVLGGRRRRGGSQPVPLHVQQVFVLLYFTAWLKLQLFTIVFRRVANRLHQLWEKLLWTNTACQQHLSFTWRYLRTVWAKTPNIFPEDFYSQSCVCQILLQTAVRFLLLFKSSLKDATVGIKPGNPRGAISLSSLFSFPNVWVGIVAQICIKQVHSSGTQFMHKNCKGSARSP